MKATPCKAWIILTLLAVMTLGGFSSCTKEDWSRCPDIVPGIKVVPANLYGVTIDPADIKTVTLYVFDSDEQFLGKVPAAVGQVTTLNFPNAGALKVVAVGNAADGSGNETVSNFNDDGCTQLSHGLISLVGATRAAAHHHSPCDLFWGDVSVDNDGETEEEKEIPMRRIVSSVNIKAVNLKDYAGVSDHNFHYEVTTDFNRVDFRGQPSGNSVMYKPANCRVTSGNVFESPTFNMISSQAGQPVAVEIYHNGDTLIDTITKDSDGNALTAVNGKLLNVHIDYTGRSIGDGWLSVVVEYSGWGDPLDIGKVIQ